jgi:hypothetical protein
MGSRRTQWIGRHRMSVTAVLVCVAAATLGSLHAIGQDRGAAAPQLDETPLRKYKAFRRMHAVNEKFNHEAWLEAWTELDESGFRYEIVSERGSETIRNKVLRTMLVREQELIAQGEAGRAELTCDNYVFEEAAPGKGVRYVVLKPKRKDMLLVDGRMVLNQTGTELLRVEGRLAKNPSFWTSLVNVTREFASLDGVRVPVATETFARLKFAGTARMTVSYEYESINGRPVSMAARQTLAAAIGR